MVHNLNLTAYEVAALIAFLLSILGSIFSVWLTTKVKIAQIETTMKLKIAEIESKITDHMLQNSKTIEKFMAANKDDHHQISTDIKDLQNNIQQLCLNMAKGNDR